MTTKQKQEFKPRLNQVITRRPDGSIRVQSVNVEPSKTRQEFKDQTNVNEIMKRYKKVGIDYNGLPDPKGSFADLTTLPSYEEACNTVAQANNAFDELPAHLRKRFNNNPVDLMDFLADSENEHEAIKLGLIPKPVPTPDPIPVSDPIPKS